MRLKWGWICFSSPLTGHPFGVPVWSCPSWLSPGCLQFWQSQIGGQRSSRSFLLSLTHWKALSLWWSIVSLGGRWAVLFYITKILTIENIWKKANQPGNFSNPTSFCIPVCSDQRNGHAVINQNMECKQEWISGCYAECTVECNLEDILNLPFHPTEISVLACWTLLFPECLHASKYGILRKSNFLIWFWEGQLAPRLTEGLYVGNST